MKTACPVCKVVITLTRRGYYRVHGKGGRCAGSLTHYAANRKRIIFGGSPAAMLLLRQQREAHDAGVDAILTGLDDGE